jgi:alpha-1,6-mannosyltransferase
MHLVDTTLFYSPTSGGVRRYLNAKHAWYLRQPQVTHSILVPGERTQLHRGDVSTIAGSIVPGTFNYRLPLSVRRWKRMLRELQPDLIEAGDAFHPAWCALDVARGLQVPAVAFFHSHLPRLIRIRVGDTIGRLAGRYVRWLYERFDLVFAPSRVMCDFLRELGLGNVVLQPLGVDTLTFHPARRGQHLRRRLGLRDDVRLLAYAGRFSAEKNIHVLRDAFARLGNQYHLLLVGGGEHQRPAPNVTLLPYHRDSAELAATLASADALVHAGTAETFGLVVLEAMACGRPVIGIRANAVAELVDDSVGISVARAEGALLARAVRDLYDRDIEALGQAARARVEAQYSWDRALQHQLTVYDTLTEKKRTVPAGWVTARRRPSGDQHALSAGPSSN